MALAMICVILLPFVIVGLTLADNVQELTTATRRWLDAGPPEPPAWLARVPVVGGEASAPNAAFHFLVGLEAGF